MSTFLLMRMVSSCGTSPVVYTVRCLHFYILRSNCLFILFITGRKRYSAGSERNCPRPLCLDFVCRLAFSITNFRLLRLQTASPRSRLFVSSSALKSFADLSITFSTRNFLFLVKNILAELILSLIHI